MAPLCHVCIHMYHAMFVMNIPTRTYKNMHTKSYRYVYYTTQYVEYSWMNIRQLHILFNSAKTWHVIVCWFLCFASNLPELNLKLFWTSEQNYQFSKSLLSNIGHNWLTWNENRECVKNVEYDFLNSICAKVSIHFSSYLAGG